MPHEYTIRRSPTRSPATSTARGAAADSRQAGGLSCRIPCTARAGFASPRSSADGAGDPAGVDDFILPLFAVHGRGVREPIGSMPGDFRLSIDELLKEAKDAASMGIPAVLLFGLPQTKDPRGSEAYAEDGIVQQAVRAVKETIPDLLVITDVCLCQYTSHGHCGSSRTARVKNDPTLELLARWRCRTSRPAPTSSRPPT